MVLLLGTWPTLKRLLSICGASKRSGISGGRKPRNSQAQLFSVSVLSKRVKLRERHESTSLSGRS